MAIEKTPLEGRIARLEAHSRYRSYALIGIMGLVVFAAFKAGRSAPEVIQAERFELVDAQGQVRAYLGVEEDGTVGLFIYDEARVARLSVSHGPEETALYLRDEAGAIRVGAAQFSHGGGGFALHGAGSKGAAALYYKGGGSLTFYDADGAILERIPVANK